MSSSMEMRKLFTSPKYLLALLIVGLMIVSSNANASPYQQGALGPEPDLYLRFRKNTPNNNRKTRSDEYIHPFIRFRKSTYSADPYRFLYPSSYAPANQ